MQDFPRCRIFRFRIKPFPLGFSILCFAALLALPCELKAQNSGALIGMEIGRAEEAQEFGDIKPPKYQTLWIAADPNGKLAVLATIPELIIPRRDGFWHLGVKQVCEFTADTDGQGGGNEEIRQAVWAASAGQAAKVAQVRECAPDAPAKEPEGSTDAAAENAHPITQCGFTLSDIEFVSPELISVRNYQSQSESCEARGGHYATTFHVRRFDEDTPASFGKLLGPEAGQAYARALPKKGKDQNGEECGEPYSSTDEEWEIGHFHGRTTLLVRQSLGNFGCSADAQIRFRLPSALSGETAVIPDWKTFQLADKEFWDAYVSPSGDLVIVITKTEIRVYELKQSTPGKLLLTLPGHPIAAVQWATGTHVKDWTAQLQKIASKPLLEPQVVVNKEPK